MPIHSSAQRQGVGAVVLQAVWSIVQPVWVVRNCWRAMPVGKAYLVHLYGLAIACAGLVILDIFTSAPYIEDAVVMRFLSGDTKDLLVAGFYFVFITQLGYPVAAFATMCWGAGPEPWAQSYLRSLARWYQLTPHHAVASLCVTGVVVLVDDFIFYWSPGQYLLISLGLLGYTALQMYVTLSALAVHELPEGWPATCRWPLLCEGCGYPLAGQAMDQGCSECGRPVSESAECGRGGISRMKPMSALFFSVTHPMRLGQLLLAFRPSHGAGKALAFGTGLIFATGPVGVVLAFIVIVILNSEEMSGIFDEPEAFVALLGMSIYSGAVAMAGMVGLALLIGSIIGTCYALFIKRPVMHLAAQAVAYTSAFLPLWMLANWVGGGLTLGSMILAFNSGSPAWAVLIPAVFVLGNIAAATFYIILLCRAIKGARWANV